VAVERATSSVSCARTYLEYAEVDTQHYTMFWNCVAIHGRVEVMEWARQGGHSVIRYLRIRHSCFWNDQVDCRSIGKFACVSAAEYRQLGALRWLR